MAIKYLSPSSLKTFESNPNNFVLKYVLGTERPGQTRPMSIGSAFDARIKAKLTVDLLGLADPFEELFETQVEEPLRDWCRENSAYLLKCYEEYGAYSALVSELSNCENIQFEFNARTDVVFEDGFTVPIFGKPDLYGHLKSGANIVFDWKVNGYCSKASPHAGYVRLYNQHGDSGGHATISHMLFHGLTYSPVATLRPEWRDQLIFYIWAIEAPEEEWLAGIDQLVFNGRSNLAGEKEMRVAQHRLRIDDSLKLDLRARVRKAWEAIQSGHYFTQLSKEQNDQKIADMAGIDPNIRFAMLYR